MSAAVERLKAARELIARPGGWIQHVWARTADGRVADIADKAVCWCCWGALRQVDGQNEARWLDRAAGGYFVADWNDVEGRTQAQAVALYDKAIALAEAEARP